MSRVRRSAVALVFAALMAVVVSLKGLDPLELWALDALRALRGGGGPRAPVTIVAIDDDSLGALGSWPLPRAMHGRVLDRLRDAGAAVIGVPLILSEPSGRGEADDQALAESAMRVPVLVLAAAVTTVSESGPSGYTKVDANLPIRALRRAAASFGHLNVNADGDAVIRRVALALEVGPLAIPAFGVELHHRALAKGIGGHALPSQTEVWINFVGPPGSFPSIPDHRVLRGQFSADAVRGRIVLVGTNARSLRDRLLTPASHPNGMSGVEIQANIIDTLLTGRGIQPVSAWGQAAMAAVCAAAAGALVGALGVFGLVVVALAIVTTGVAAWLALALASVWLPLVGVTLALAGGAMAQIVAGRR